MTKPAPRTRQPEVTAAPFVRAHGKDPKGRSSGWWFAPCANRTAYHDDIDYDSQAVFDGTFTEARAQARRHFAALGVDTIAVLS